MVKLALTSDLHGTLPSIPNADAVLIAGDICPATNHNVKFQLLWLNNEFDRWLRNTGFDKHHIIGVVGNHDWAFQESPHLINLPWTYLQDNFCMLDNLKVYGTPWQPTFYDWAFNLDEADLAKKWDLIPDDSDILIVHGPPYGTGDVTYGNRHCGSPSLYERILEVQPKLVVCGHIHSGYGTYKIGNTTVVNASMMDEDYRPVNPIVVVDI